MTDDPFELDMEQGLWTAALRDNRKGLDILIRETDKKYDDPRGTRAGLIVEQLVSGFDSLDPGEVAHACVLLAEVLPIVFLGAIKTRLAGDLSDTTRRRILDMMATAAAEYAVMLMTSQVHHTKLAIALDRYAVEATDALRDGPNTTH